MIDNEKYEIVLTNMENKSDSEEINMERID